MLRDFLLTELYKPKELQDFRNDTKGRTEVDTRDQSWSYNLPTYFERYGFKLLGAGKYASVFGNPKYPFVIKVFMKDAAFLKWMQFCKDNPTNPYCPKIKGKISKLSDLFFAVRIEKLTPTKMEAYDRFNQALKSGKSDDKSLQDVVDYLNSNKNLLDIHSENVMMRGEQLVVIDPFYNWFDVKASKYTIDPNKVDLKGLI